ncbi:NAD-dependent epimerase/dehydratase family protein [Propionibacteriaceae bacterium Y1685]
MTGASGLLGRNVSAALVARGDEVTVLQRRASGLDCREVRGDVSDPEVVRRAVSGQDAVIHAAAKVNVVGAWRDYERVNIGGTRHIVDACRTAGVGRLVHVSSPSVAHVGRSIVGAAATPADPGATHNAYNRSKAYGERIALDADHPDLAVLAIRPHLIWGPGDTQLVARIVTRAKAGRLPIIGSGAPLVDTTYIDNAVDALVSALDAEAHGEALVVTNGEPRPIGEILTRLAVAGGAEPPRRRVPVPVARLAAVLVEGALAVRSMAPGDALESDPPLNRFLVEQLSTAHWFDQRHTRQVLGWRPRISLDEGFSRLSDWYARH